VNLSIGCPPGPGVRELAVRAEQLGYDRIWLYDSAALYEDVWIHLAQLAEATDRIGLGTAVLVPNLRHVMTTASAIATVARLAPGRLACAFGTGYTARAVLGKPALSWKRTREYVEQLQGLLRGDVVEIEGKPCQMIHQPELAIARPIDVPILLSAFGAVFGMLLPQESGARQLPADVSFAADAAAIRAVLAQAGIELQGAVPAGQMAPEDLTRLAQGMTVLVSCWD